MPRAPGVTARARPAPGRTEYEKRVNRGIDHVRAHLGEELSLPELARVAAFSPFHFHRVFRAITGEALFAFVQRVRAEQAAAALRDHPDRSVLEVALDHGFSSAATFARAFRAHCGMSATEWRAGGAEPWRRQRERERNQGKPIRKPGKAAGARRADTPRTRREEAPMSVQVRMLPTRHVAYMRYVGPFGPHGIPELWARLRTWMPTRDLRLADTVRLGIAYDDPRITAPAQCRYDACVVVPADFAPDRSVGVMDVRGGRHAVAPFHGGPHEILAAWEQVFGAWLPDSGYEPDDRPCFEDYRGDPAAGAGGVFRCDLCLPVRSL